MFAPIDRAASLSTSTHFFRLSGSESNTATPTTPPDKRPSLRLRDVTDAHALDSPILIWPNCGDGGAEPSEEDRGLVRGASGSGERKAKVPAGGAGSRGGGGRPPGRPKSGGAACLDAQRPAILEKVAPASLMSLVPSSGLSVDTDGMARVAGAGVGAADDGATGRAAPARGESVMAPLLWRFARGESVMAVGGGGSGAIIFL